MIRLTVAAVALSFAAAPALACTEGKEMSASAAPQAAPTTANKPIKVAKATPAKPVAAARVTQLAKPATGG